MAARRADAWVLLALAVALGAAPADQKVTLEVVPASVDLHAGGPDAQALVVVRNGTTETLRDVRLNWWTDAGVRAVLEDRSPCEIAPGGDSAWTLHLGRTGDGPLPGTVHLRADYDRQAEDNQPTTPHVALAEITVKRPDAETLDQVADVQVKMFLEDLTEQGEGLAYVLITNKANVPLDASVHVYHPRFIQVVNGDALATPATLEPKQNTVITVPLKTSGQIHSGKYLLVFDVELSWGATGRRQQRHMIATQEVVVGLLGESTLTKFLGVPSLLVLPGFLILVVINTLWKWRFLRPEAHPNEPPLLEVNSSPFWVVAITLSGIVIAAYWWQTGRNLLDGYQMRDVTILWIISFLGLGLGGYVLVVVLHRTALALWKFASFLRNYFYVWPRTFTEDDKTLTVLWKLHRRGQGIRLPRYELGDPAHPRHVFSFERAGDHPANAWVGPPIVVTRQDQVSTLPPAKLQDLLERIDQERNRTDPPPSPKALARLLDEGQRAQAIDVHWRTVDDIDGLVQRPAADLHNHLGDGLLLEWVNF